MVEYLEVRLRVIERSSSLCSGLSKSLQGSIMYVSKVSEDSVYEHWLYGINEETREWLIQIGLLVKENKRNSIQVFVVCEPDQCTKRQYNRRRSILLSKESVNCTLNSSQVKVKIGQGQVKQSQMKN